MSVYLKKMDDGTVKAMGDLETTRLYGGYDRKISDSNWVNKYHCVARLDANGVIALGPTDEQLEEWREKAIRKERDSRLRRDCDSISALRLSDMSKAERTKWAEYRQALLDVPEQSGFPWDGDVDKAPWPTKPE